MIGIGLHLVARDSRVSPAINRGLSAFASGAWFDGTSAYKPELFTLYAGLAAISAPWAVQWLRRYARAWWAGISSALIFVSAVETIGLLGSPAFGSRLNVIASVAGIVALFAAELWRHQPHGASKASLSPNLNIPLPTKATTASQWKANISDNPITDWGSDVAGRAAVVELLADYVLVQRIPVLALHGGLGDGKSSVLNLLRGAIDDRAIVIPFSAWLPGSEVSLATVLFNDIARECGKRVYVPRLRKRGLTFARTLSGSVPHLAGLKEMIPAQSQREEIEELCETFSRIPMPIVVLLDEIDRMQKEELLVLLKILRGASSIPNVTFVCALSESDVRRELGKEGGLSHEYMEKFFPVSVKLSPPSPDTVAKCLLPSLRRRLAEQNWFSNEQEEAAFVALLKDAWTDGFQPFCTNLRKAGMLLNAVIAAGRPIAGEVNPFDLTVIEALRLFSPEIYSLIRTGFKALTDSNATERRSTRNESQPFFAALTTAVDGARESTANRRLLSLLFPEYARSSGDRLTAIMAANARKDERGRICDSEYFNIYFRDAVPEEMFSNSELTRFILAINDSRTEGDAQNVFSGVLDAIPAGRAKRTDFLWKLSRAIERVSDSAAEYLAYAAAAHAADFQYDLWTMGELGRALNIILSAAQKLSATSNVQRVLEGVMSQATDDTLAIRLLDYLENPSPNGVFTDFSNVDVPLIKRVFIERMRVRYVPGSTVSLAQSDWRALVRWGANSDEDSERAHTYFRAFVGRSRKKLAQAINIIYPGGSIWEESPAPLVDRLLPIMEIETLLRELTEDEPLDAAETEGIARIKRLFAGTYSTRSNFPGT